MAAQISPTVFAEMNGAWSTPVADSLARVRKPLLIVSGDSYPPACRGGRSIAAWSGIGSIGVRPSACPDPGLLERVLGNLVNALRIFGGRRQPLVRVCDRGHRGTCMKLT
jgi:hypothetical protein